MVNRSQNRQVSVLIQIFRDPKSEKKMGVEKIRVGSHSRVSLRTFCENLDGSDVGKLSESSDKGRIVEIE